MYSDRETDTLKRMTLTAVCLIFISSSLRAADGGLSRTSSNLPSEIRDLLNKKFPGWRIPERDPEDEKARLEVLELTNKQIKAGQRKKADYPGYDELANPSDWKDGDFNSDGQEDYLLSIAIKSETKLLAIMGGKELKEFVLSTQKGQPRFDFEVFKKGSNFGNYQNFSNDTIFFNTYQTGELESSHVCQWSDSEFSCEEITG